MFRAGCWPHHSKQTPTVDAESSNAQFAVADSDLRDAVHYDGYGQGHRRPTDANADDACPL